MDLLRTLLAKDLKRVRRNPIPVLVQIGIAMLLVLVIGLTFGKQARSGSGFAPIKLSIVDEDKSVFAELLQNAVTSKEFAEYFDTQFLEREEAVALINENELSAVVVIPEGFTDAFLDGGENAPPFELIKNPAQSLYPAIVEEGMNVLVTLLNALARNFGEGLRQWRSILEAEEETDFFSTVFLVSSAIQEAREQLEGVRSYLSPPLVSFESTTRDDGRNEEEESASFNVYAFLFAGMAGMFLLMIANSATSDIYREARFGTLKRFSAIHGKLHVLVVEKMLLVIVITSISAVVMFLGGSLAFGFSWLNPVAVAALTAAYCVCGAGITCFIASLSGKERRADSINTIVIMGLAILSGTMVPVDQMPALIRDLVSPNLPPAWFIGTVRELQVAGETVDWAGVALRLVLTGLGLVAISSFIFHRRMLKGAAA